MSSESEASASGNSKASASGKDRPRSSPRRSKFTKAARDSEWYKAMKLGSCDEIIRLLRQNAKLLVQRGYGGRTALHATVIGCRAELVEEVLLMCKDAGQGSALSTNGGVTLTDLLQAVDFLCHQTALAMALVIGNANIVQIMMIAVRWKTVMEDRAAKRVADLERGEGAVSAQERGISDTLSNDFISYHARQQAADANAMQNRQQLRDIIKQSISRKEDKWNRIVDDVFHKNGFRMERELEYLFHHLCYVKQSSSPEFLIVFEAMMIIVTSLAKFGLGLVSFLFKLQDGGGMTPLHAAVSTHDSQTVSAVLSMLNHISLEPDQTDQQLQLVIKDCVNAVDGAGRTPLHRAIAQHSGAEGSFDTFMVVESLVRDKRTDLNAFFKPILTRPAADTDILCHFDGTFTPHSKLLNALFTDQTPLVSLRCMMLDEKWQDTTALQLAVIHNLPRCVELLLAEEKGDRLDVSPLAVRAVNFGAEKGTRLVRWTLLQLAAAMGNEAVLQMLLPHVDKIYDVGKLQNTSRRSNLEEFSQPFSTLPALHLAAGSGNPEAVRMILETRKFDPIVTDSHYGSTPLHWAVNAALIEEDFRGLEDFVDVQGLQSAYKLRRSRPTPIGYSGKKGCVNLLLQAGLDIWHRDKEGKIPNPGSNALEDSRTWWYEKLDAVTKDTNNNLTLAANAISVTAALVATASFVGPLQPPLGYETTYIHYELFLVKVFIVCVSLSFYFAVAAIMISVIPSLPLPHAPLQVELQRTQRLVLAGVCLLLVSILCVLVSFAASTIVVLPKKSGHRVLTIITAMVGELTCLVVFLLFVFRLVRLVYYKNDHVRRFYDGMVRLKWHGL